VNQCLGRCNHSAQNGPRESGAGEWTRTIDLLITKHGLTKPRSMLRDGPVVQALAPESLSCLADFSPRLARGARYADRCLDAAYFTTAGAGLANLAGSIATFGWISFSSMLDLPSVHVITILYGSFTPATSR
jgi:hypothetical protein